MEKISLASFNINDLKRRLELIKIEYTAIFDDETDLTYELFLFATKKVKENFNLSFMTDDENTVVSHLMLFLLDIPLNKFSYIYEIETPLMEFTKENKLQICLN
jgi:hypothetical protein